MTMLEQRNVSLGVALLIAFLFAATNLPWQLDDYDQAKQAFTSFEMMQEGHWLYQHTPNEKIATKPPLVGWISAGCYAITRSWETAWRLPSLGAAIVLVALIARAAGSARGTGAGLIAMAACGLNLLSPRLATLVRTDMPLALIIFLIGLKIWRKIRAAEAWQTRDRVEMFVLLTASMLIKGPIVYAFLLPGIIAFQFWKRRSGNIASAWCGWWPWIVSLLIFLFWVAGGIAFVPQFYEQVVVREFAGRFGETFHRPQPFYFYLPHLLHKFAPWSLLSLGLGVVAWRNRATRSKISPEIFWLVVWSLGGLLIMSVVPSKRVDRIFPIVPPLCLLLAAQFSWAKDRWPQTTRWAFGALIFACVFSGGYTAQKVFASYRADDAALVRFGKIVREEAATNHWRYEIVGGKEEGLLLYLRRTHFLRPAEAVALWNSGALDALVVAADELPSVQSQLKNALASGLQASVTINGNERRYFLLTKSAP